MKKDKHDNIQLVITEGWKNFKMPLVVGPLNMMQTIVSYQSVPQ